MTDDELLAESDVVQSVINGLFDLSKTLKRRLRLLNDPKDRKSKRALVRDSLSRLYNHMDHVIDMAYREQSAIHAQTENKFHRGGVSLIYTKEEDAC